MILRIARALLLRQVISKGCTHHFEPHCAAKEAPLTRKGATVARRDTATGDSPHRS